MNDPRSHGLVRALWQDLLRGALSVVAPPLCSGYELVLGPAQPPTSSAARQRRQECLQAVLRGKQQKVASSDLRRAPATVASMLKGALADLGLETAFSRVPIALPLLAHAAAGAGVVALCELGRHPCGQTRWRLAFSPLTPRLHASLSAAECDVVTRYLVGESYFDIARARGASTRTVANQLALSFHKLGASGRFSLIEALVRDESRPLTLRLLQIDESGDAAPRFVAPAAVAQVG